MFDARNVLKLFINLDIDECSKNETVYAYMNKNLTKIYKWSGCNETTSVCVNTIGSYECKCLNGFIENGDLDCIDIDECVENRSFNKTNCKINSECVNYPGSYNCVCKNGFIENNGDCIGALFKAFEYIFLEIILISK